jgi:phosphorylase kinase alpha/beta subunit
MSDDIELILGSNALECQLKGTTFREMSPKEKLTLAYKHLESLRQLNGGYVASPYTGDKGGDMYKVFWLRDIMYATYANEYIGAYDKMIESYRLVLTIFQKYHYKISSGARKRHYMGSCADEVVHARVHPSSLEEITSEWGHHQLDILGLFLYKSGDLIKKGHKVIGAEEAEVRVLLRDIVLYLTTVRWHSDPDFGMWEEGPEQHSSSVGSVLAGLTMWHDDGHYHSKYRHEVNLFTYVPIPQEFLEIGRESLNRLLPAESASRPFDIAQLSLIWPYNIVTEVQAKAIIGNIEANLVRDRGTIRYIGDVYYSADKDNPVGNEAQWPLGFAWLSIVYSKLASRSISVGKLLGSPEEFINKSQEYLDRLEAVMTDDGKVPELYCGEHMNPNVPLAWAQSFYIVARQNLANVRDIIKYNMEPEGRR